MYNFSVANAGSINGKSIEKLYLSSWVFNAVESLAEYILVNIKT